jgi:hypothetical protein
VSARASNLGPADRAALLELEREGWGALSTGGGAAAVFYADVLASDVLMLFPGGTVIDDRDKVIASMGGPPWSAFELADQRVLPLGADSAIVAYRATARRDGTTYQALVASTYVLEGGAWKLAVHQQTPI